MYGMTHLFVRVVDVQQGQVVAVYVRELSLGLVCSFGGLPRPHEYGGRGEHGHDRQHLRGVEKGGEESGTQRRRSRDRQ